MHSFYKAYYLILNYSLALPNPFRGSPLLQPVTDFNLGSLRLCHGSTLAQYKSNNTLNWLREQGEDTRKTPWSGERRGLYLREWTSMHVTSLTCTATSRPEPDFSSWKRLSSSVFQSGPSMQRNSTTFSKRHSATCRECSDHFATDVRKFNSHGRHQTKCYSALHCSRRTSGDGESTSERLCSEAESIALSWCPWGFVEPWTEVGASDHTTERQKSMQGLDRYLWTRVALKLSVWRATGILNYGHKSTGWC